MYLKYLCSMFLLLEIHYEDFNYKFKNYIKNNIIIIIFLLIKVNCTILIVLWV